MVVHLVVPLKQFLITVSRQKSSICVQMWENLADILQKLAAKKPVKSWLLCVAKKNLRLKNSYICTKIWLSAPKITKTRKLQQYFFIIVNICPYHGHKNRQKDENSIFFIDIHPGPKFGPC